MAVHPTVTAAMPIFLLDCFAAITPDQKLASNALEAIESCFSPLPTPDPTVCGSQPIIQSRTSRIEANGTGFGGQTTKSIVWPEFTNHLVEFSVLWEGRESEEAAEV